MNKIQFKQIQGLEEAIQSGIAAVPTGALAIDNYLSEISGDGVAAQLEAIANIGLGGFRKASTSREILGGCTFDGTNYISDVNGTAYVVGINEGGLKILMATGVAVGQNLSSPADLFEDGFTLRDLWLDCFGRSMVNVGDLKIIDKSLILDGWSNTSTRDPDPLKDEFGSANNLVWAKNTNVSGWHNVAMGQNNKIENSLASFIGGTNSVINKGNISFVYGEGCTGAAQAAFVHGYYNTAQANLDHAEGAYCVASGGYSHVEGERTRTLGAGSHAEGYNSLASGDYSHSEGINTSALGSGTHAEGTSILAIGHYSHAEGAGNTSIGLYSHVEGGENFSVGDYSHAEGAQCQSSGLHSHAEGFFTRSIGVSSHSEGHGAFSENDFSHAAGLWNKTGFSGQGVIHQIGVGTGSRLDAENALRLDGERMYDDGFLVNRALTSVNLARVLSGEYGIGFNAGGCNIFYNNGSTILSGTIALS